MPRIPSLDLARGFTVFIMPAVHTVMLYSNTEVQQSSLITILQFLAEGPGAQLFMLMMGISFVLSAKPATHIIHGIPLPTIKRTFYLFIAAYLLNFCKLVIPVALGFMPESLLNEFHFASTPQAVLFFLGMGDILHFAAIAFPILFLIDKCINSIITYSIKYDDKLNDWFYISFPVVLLIPIILFSPMLWDLKTNNDVLNYLLQLMGGHPPQVYFPVFPWLAYPVAGLSIGYAIRMVGINKTMKGIMITGVGLLLIASGVPQAFPMATNVTIDFPAFYRAMPAGTMYHLGFVLVWLSAVHFISIFIKDNLFFDLLTYCSKNITTIYFAQWILVFWCMGLTGYHTLNLLQTVFWIATNSATSFFIPYLINHYEHKKNI